LTHHAVKQYCAEKVLGKGKGKYYRYLILGDDSLDTNKDVHNKYIDVMKRLGMSISLSKCTQSEQGSTEFAKRLFLNKVEVTGLPMTLLEEVLAKPEQFIELVRIARERGYSDVCITPGLSHLLTKHRNGKLVADLLSLPETVSGMRPIMDVKPGS
jgi:hypothetical protein